MTFFLLAMVGKSYMGEIVLLIHTGPRMDPTLYAAT